MDIKYHDENGNCIHCKSPANALHRDDCPVEIASQQHHKIVHEVFYETWKQLDRWDVQNHPAGTSPTRNQVLRSGLWSAVSNKHAADFARNLTDSAAHKGTLTYADIAVEEFFEMLAEDPGEEMETEAIQTAAVLVSMVAASRRARGAV